MLSLQEFRFAVLVVGLSLSAIACPGGGGGSSHTDANLEEEEETGSVSEYRTALQLGRGVNAAQTNLYATCVTTPTKSENLKRTEELFQQRRVSERDGLHGLDSLLGINALAGAQAAWGQYAAVGSFFQDATIDKDSFYWLIDAKYEVVQESIDVQSKEFVLTEEAKRVLADPNLPLDAFYKMCGTQFYVSNKKGARYSLLYQISSVEDRPIQRLIADSNNVGWGMSNKPAFQSLLQQAEKNGALRVYAHTQAHSDTVTELATKPTDLEDKLKQIQTDIFKSRQGVVLEWKTESYNIFPEVARASDTKKSSPEFDTTRETAAKAYYRAYHDNLVAVRRLQRQLDQAAGDNPLFSYTDADTTRMNQEIDQLLNRNEEIASRARDCLNGANSTAVCRLTDLTPISLAEHRAAKDFSGLGSWRVSLVVRDQAPNRVDFSASPGGNCTGPSQTTIPCPQRTYATGNDVLLKSGDEILVENNNTINRGDGFNSTQPIRIGSNESLLLIALGIQRPRICIGDYADLCALRVIESPSTRHGDGTPQAKIQLVIFDKFGFVAKRFDFNTPKT